MPLSSLIPALLGGVVGTAPSEPVQPVPTEIVRTLPQEAKKGVMLPPRAGQVQIDGRTLALAPGLQIRNERNLIVMADSLRQPVTVRYHTDAAGAVSRVWVLTPHEAAAAP